MKILNLYSNLDKKQKKNIRTFVCSNSGISEATFYLHLNSSNLSPWELKIFQEAFNKYGDKHEQG